MEIVNLFRFKDFNYRYNNFKELIPLSQKSIIHKLEIESQKFVEIIAYCLMPTHIHLILKQLVDDGISKFMGRVLNSYTRYFNIRHDRTGPLWETRFKGVRINTDEQLLHTTRYLHLNSVSAGLAEKPEDWKFSSYGEYIGTNKEGICNLNILPDFTPAKYKKFTNNQKSYQKSLQTIKNLLIDE